MIDTKGLRKDLNWHLDPGMRDKIAKLVDQIEEDQRIDRLTGLAEPVTKTDLLKYVINSSDYPEDDDR